LFCQKTHHLLKVGDEVEMIGMAPVEECEHDMFIEMDWDDAGLGVPLSHLEPIDADDETWEALGGGRGLALREQEGLPVLSQRATPSAPGISIATRVTPHPLRGPSSCAF
jgi:hypothetical protein